MESVHEDRFVVYLRRDRGSYAHPENAERPLTACSTYADARRIQRELQRGARECVIRYVGPAGGGD
jgi:hypothetical protein